jgi:carbon starvation protein CstA
MVLVRINTDFSRSIIYMITFIIGLAILVVGGLIYGRVCENVFGPDDRKTPAYAKQDNVDYVPMKRWKNSLVNLLNIAGTGPILGPIQGILFGPVAFITIPIGCVIGGAMHDYFTGMICTREGGLQMPEMIRRFQKKGVFWFFTAFVCITCFLCGVVFVYTPGDIAATQLFGFGGTAGEVSTWIIYGAIFIYYLIATVLPIDKIIGKVYPVFGGLLIVSAIGIFIMLFVTGNPLCELWGDQTLGGFDFKAYFTAQHFIPAFFVTVACGIMSGFHSTQTSLIARTLESEKHGRMTFYNMMLCEGFIAMVWAAGTMAVIGLGAENAGITMQMTESGWGYFQSVDGVMQKISATSVVGVVCKYMLGNAGGIIAIIGVIILPISTGDTAFRSLRLMIAETFHIRQDSVKRRLVLSGMIFMLALGLVIWAKNDSNGFNTIWRYFGWANQTVSVFATSSIFVYLVRSGKARFAWMPAIPLVFYSFITSAYLFNAPIGFSLDIGIAYIIAGVFTAFVLAGTVYTARR